MLKLKQCALGMELGSTRIKTVIIDEHQVINPNVLPAPRALQDKHDLRKHGKNAYYGQDTGKTGSRG